MVGRLGCGPEMRILHVVTLVDDRGSYGGPLTVALGHCAELRRRGHDAVLAAGWQGEGDPPDVIEEVPAHLFRVRSVVPGLRYAGLYSATMHRWLRRNARAFDVAHLHLARDLVPLTAASALRRAGVPYMVQSHGMIRPDRRGTARALDAVLTLPALRGARRIYSLTPVEDRDLAQLLSAAGRTTRLRNGIDAAGPEASRGHQKEDERLDVLFLARLHPRKRVVAFAKAAAALIGEGIDANFSIVGPDGGDLPALRAFLAERPDLTGRLIYEGPLAHEEALARLRRADVYVLPSVDEPYPMTVLEALSAGVAVVLTERCGLASTLRAADAAQVVGSTQEGLLEGLREVAANGESRRQLSARAVESAVSTFSLTSVVDKLEGGYVMTGPTCNTSALPR